MAELVASPIISSLMEKLATKFWKEVEMMRGVEEDIEKLQSILSAINCVLEDAQKRSIIGDKFVCDWLKKLKDAAYDADDVLDDFQYEVARRRKMKDLDSITAQVRNFFSSDNTFKVRHDIGKKIKKVIKKLNDIADEKEKFHLSVSGGAAVPSRPVDRQTHAGVIPSKVYGRDEDKEKVVKFLLDDEYNNISDDYIPVLSIVGLGGIGKTTLAQLAYNDERINPELFDLKIWVCVSEEFDVKRITREIIECVKKQKCDDLGFEPLRGLVEEALGGKKVLLVLDDVWTEESLKWEELISLLRCFNNKGSKMIVTTRDKAVARVVGSVLSQPLESLSFDDCWIIFKERAFGGVGKEEETDPVLVEIGKEIVRKCGGLPLAAKAMGGLMSRKRGEVEWQAIKNSEIWSLPNDDDKIVKILPALRLSYYHLSPCLKQCFTYCALFPKDWYFDKDILIELWIGEGFIPSSMETYTCPEDLGNSYFNILLQGSFFQGPVVKYTGGEDYYTMHDLMHDVACSVAKDEFSMMLIREEVKPFDNCRYLSLLEDNASPDAINLSTKPEKLRSLILIQKYWLVNTVNWDVLLRSRNIRVLDLGRDTRFRELDLGREGRFNVTNYIPLLPAAICKLKHLRLLDLSGSCVTTLPITIGNLYNLSRLILRECRRLKELPETIGHLYNLSALDLQGCDELVELPDTVSRLHNLYTLNLEYCSSLKKLPCGISNMSSLKHLNAYRCESLIGFPPGIGRLSKLQTLSKFIVGEEEGHHITELEHLNEIRGRLGIYQLEKVRNAREVEKANLAAKMHVKQYELEWSWWRREEEMKTEDEGIIESLHPPPNVTDLRISGYGGSRYPSWIMLRTTELLSSLLQNLVDIELCGLNRCEWLPPFGQLPSLKRLNIWGMDGVRRIGEEFYYGHMKEGGCSRKRALPFPLLEELHLNYMPSLEEWVMEAGDVKREMMFPCLTWLFVRECPKLRVLPGLPVSVTDLRIWGKGVLSTGSFAGLSSVRRLVIPSWEARSSYSWRELFQYLTSLDSLSISDPEEMDCLPESITQCHIPSLRSLHLLGHKKLTSLGDPQQQQHQEPPPLFASLHNLSLFKCEALSALPEWLGGLTCLLLLHLDCPKLEMLPDGLQHLTTLAILRIKRCPLTLVSRLEKETGEDWHKISHIPDVIVNDRRY